MASLFEFSRSDRTILAFALLCVVHSASGVEIKAEQIEQRYPVNPDAVLTIQHQDGAIKIRGGDDGEISIRATKKAYTSDRLKEIVIDVKAAPNAVAIETILPPTKGLLDLGDRSGTVDYFITVPKTMRITRLNLNCGELIVEGLRGGQVTAFVGDGWLVANNCFEDLDLKIMNGRLEVAYDWWENARFRVTLSSRDGNIRINIPEYASATIAARSVEGRIINGLPGAADAGTEPVRVLNVNVGTSPIAAFDINVTSGDIRLNKPY